MLIRIQHLIISGVLFLAAGCSSIGGEGNPGKKSLINIKDGQAPVVQITSVTVFPALKNTKSFVIDGTVSDQTAIRLIL